MASKLESAATAPTAAGPSKPASASPAAPGRDHGLDQAADRYAPEALHSFGQRRAQEQQQELDALRGRAKPDPLPPEDQWLAAYLTARTIDGRPVEEEDLDRLRRGHAAVVDTRKALKYGRGNVQTDVEATNRDSLYRLYAGREVVDEMAEGGEPTSAHYAAAALLVEAGNCGEFARVAAYQVANGRLADYERLHVVGVATADHQFAQIRSPAGHRHDVVVDPWATGSAVLAPDGAFSASRGFLHKEDLWAGDKAKADRFVEEVRGHGVMVEKELRAVAEEFIDEQRRTGQALGSHTQFLDSPVVSSAFARRAAEKMDTPVDPRQFMRHSFLNKAKRQLFGSKKPVDPLRDMRNQMHAVAALRTLDSDVRHATAQAEAVVSKAHDLRKTP